MRMRNQHDGHDEAEPEGPEGLVHVVDGASHREDGAMRRMHSRDDLVDVCADRGKALGLRHDVDVEDPAELIVVDFGWRVDRLNGRDCLQRCRELAVG
jgi:hypothetical protein